MIKTTIAALASLMLLVACGQDAVPKEQDTQKAPSNVVSAAQTSVAQTSVAQTPATQSDLTLTYFNLDG